MEGAVIAVLADLEQPGWDALDGPVDRRVVEVLLDAQLIGLGETQQVSPCVVQGGAATLDYHQASLARQFLDRVSYGPMDSWGGTRHTLAAVQFEDKTPPLDAHAEPPCPTEEGVQGARLVGEAVADGGLAAVEPDGLLNASHVLSAPVGVEGLAQASQLVETNPDTILVLADPQSPYGGQPSALADGSSEVAPITLTSSWADFVSGERLEQRGRPHDVGKLRKSPRDGAHL